MQEFCLCFPIHPATNLPPVMADMTDLRACQVPSVQSWSHVTPPAACQKLIVLIGKRQSCNKALRGDPPTQMKGLRFDLCQGLVGNRCVRWPAGQEGRTTVLWPVCVYQDRRRWGMGNMNWIIHHLDPTRHKDPEIIELVFNLCPMLISSSEIPLCDSWTLFLQLLVCIYFKINVPKMTTNIFKTWPQTSFLESKHALFSWNLWSMFYNPVSRIDGWAQKPDRNSHKSFNSDQVILLLQL